MKLWKFLIILICLFSFSQVFASMPVEITIIGCVKNGILTDTETDFGTHKVKRDYKREILDKDTRERINLSPYNGKVLKIKGYLLPGDRFFIDKSSIQVIDSCEAMKKLSIQKQELIAKNIFKKLSKTDEKNTEVFIENYKRVINECPDTEWAQEAYWRLTNLYLNAVEKPDYERVISLLEEAIKKYPNTPATPHYKKRLLFVYEETKQWSKAVKLYEEAIKNNPELISDSENSAFMIGYADALSGSGDKQKALKILKQVISFEGKIDDWLIDVAKNKIKELEHRETK